MSVGLGYLNHSFSISNSIDICLQGGRQCLADLCDILHCDYIAEETLLRKQPGADPYARHAPCIPEKERQIKQKCKVHYDKAVISRITFSRTGLYTCLQISLLDFTSEYCKSDEVYGLAVVMLSPHLLAALHLTSMHPWSRFVGYLLL